MRRNDGIKLNKCTVHKYGLRFFFYCLEYVCILFGFSFFPIANRKFNGDRALHDDALTYKHQEERKRVRERFTLYQMRVGSIPMELKMH